MSRVEFIEGRDHARRIVEDACRAPAMFYGTTGVETVIGNLRSAMAGRPADFVAGVRSILETVEKIRRKATA